MISAYDVLGVGARSDRGEIRAAYVNLAKQLHPDRNAGSVQAEQRLREVNQAYELLKDPKRRSAYDQLLQQSRGRTIRHRQQALCSRRLELARCCCLPGSHYSTTRCRRVGAASRRGRLKINLLL
jgi:curved DNA-binding protein CbpA